MSEINRLENESRLHFIWRIYKYQKDNGKLTNEQVGEICRKELNETFDESAYRKVYQSWENMWLEVKDEYISEEALLERLYEIDEREDELYKTKVKTRAEVNEKYRLLTEEARAELMFERIDESIDRFQSYKPRVIPKPIVVSKKDKSGLVAFADSHYGVEFKIEGLKGDIISEYNPEVFKNRMWQLRDEIFDFSKLHNIKHFAIVDLGDSIEGLIHLGQLKMLRGNIVDHILDYADFIDDWLTELSKDILIDFYTSEGNHADLRLISGKKGDMPHENLEKIYSRNIIKALKDNPNVAVHRSVRGLNYFNLQGFNILTAHGQDDSNINTCISDYEDTYDIDVDYFICGHMHSKKEIDANGGKESIQVRSLMGCNDYSVKIKKYSDAGALIFSVEKDYGKHHCSDVKFI